MERHAETVPMQSLCNSSKSKSELESTVKVDQRSSNSSEKPTSHFSFGNIRIPDLAEKYPNLGISPNHNVSGAKGKGMKDVTGGKVSEKRLTSGSDKKLEVKSASFFLDFSYEKHQMEIIGEENISKFQEDAPEAYMESSDPRLKKILEVVKVELYNAENSVRRWTWQMKLWTGIFSMIATVTMLSAFFGILYLALNTTDIKKFMLWVCFEIISSIIQMYLSLRGGAAAQAESRPDLLLFAKLSIIASSVYFTILAILLIIFPPSTIKEQYGKNENDSDDPDAKLYITVVCIFLGLTILKLISFILYCCCAVFLRKALNIIEMKTIEFKQLPIGYKWHIMPTRDKVLCAPYDL